MSDARLASIELDPATLPAPTAEIEEARRVAIVDLIGANHFAPVGGAGGPYALRLSMQDARLVFEVEGEGFSKAHGLSMSSLNRAVKDYIEICDSYYEALRGSSPSKIEAVDMGRRGLHNDGADLLRGRLEGKVVMDHETARRMFTLLAALYRR